MKEFFIWILLFRQTYQQMQPEVKEYCQREVMNATCDADHAIMMSSAFYGRMRLGRCIETEVYIGCSLDVLQELDERCSGRQHCEVTIPDYDLHLHKSQPCPKDMFAYLEASYECVRVFSPTSVQIGNCDVGHPIYVSAAHGGYIVGKTDTPQCPFRITSSPGQMIRIYLYDFDAEDILTDFDESIPDSDCEKTYATVVDMKADKDYNICSARERVSIALTSSGHAVDLFIRQTQHIKFMITFAAIGCADPTPPANSTVHRRGDHVTVTCDHTSVMWHLECRGSKWVGLRRNCSFPATKVQVKIPISTWVVPGEEPQRLHAYGLLVAIFVGITVGALSGFVLLAFVLLCRRAFRRRDGCLTQKLNSQTDGCPNYGVLTNQHITAQQLTNESPYTHIWRLERSATLPSVVSEVSLPVTPNSSTLCRCSKRYATSDSDDYAMSLRSDYVDRRAAELNNEINNERLAQTPDGSPKLQNPNVVTYVCRRNKDYDKINQVPQIVQDSQGCTVLKNNSLVKIQEETLQEKLNE